MAVFEELCDCPGTRWHFANAPRCSIFSSTYFSVLLGYGSNSSRVVDSAFVLPKVKIYRSRCFFPIMCIGSSFTVKVQRRRSGVIRLLRSKLMSALRSISFLVLGPEVAHDVVLPSSTRTSWMRALDLFTPLDIVCLCPLPVFRPNVSVERSALPKVEIAAWEKALEDGVGLFRASWMEAFSLAMTLDIFRRHVLTLSLTPSFPCEMGQVTTDRVRQ